MDEPSNISTHAAMGPKDSWASKQSNALAATLFAGGFGALALGAVGFAPSAPLAPAFGAAGFVLGVALLIYWQVRKKTANAAKVAHLNKQVDAPKQQEFELRYEEARKSGAFKKWEQDQK